MVSWAECASCFIVSCDNHLFTCVSVVVKFQFQYSLVSGLFIHDVFGEGTQKIEGACITFFLILAVGHSIMAL